MNSHKFVRVVAALREGGQTNEQCKFYLLCGIDSEKKILQGQWMGYYKNGDVWYPFVFETHREQLFFGWDEHYAEKTNICKRVMQAETMFTVSGVENGEMWEHTYQILTVHAYDQ